MITITGYFYIQYMPLNVITLGPSKTDNINRMITRTADITDILTLLAEVTP